MKKITHVFTILSFVFIITSCTKNCQTCTNVNGSGIDQQFCKEDFASVELYNEAIRLLETNGSKCK